MDRSQFGLSLIGALLIVALAGAALYYVYVGVTGRKRGTYLPQHQYRLPEELPPHAD